MKAGKTLLRIVNVYVYIMTVSMKTCRGMIQPQIQMSISEERRNYLALYPCFIEGRFAANMAKCEDSIKLVDECMGVHYVFKYLKYFTILKIKNIETIL